MRKRALSAVVGAGWIVAVGMAATGCSQSTSSSGPLPMGGIAAIVEADAVNARYSYDEQMGPRTIVDLANIVLHAGPATVPTTLSQYGGPLPDGTYVTGSEVPLITPGSRYVLFLTSESWFYTPIWTPLSFRVEQLGSKRFLVGATGLPVKAIGSGSLTFGSTRVVDTGGFVNPLEPLFRNPEMRPSDPEIASALDHDAFVSDAIDAVRQAAAPLGAQVAPLPDLLGQSNWRITTGGSK